MSNGLRFVLSQFRNYKYVYAWRPGKLEVGIKLEVYLNYDMYHEVQLCYESDLDSK